MSDQHYIDHADRYGERCSPSIQPATTAYPEPPYSVTTFSQPQQAEPHLLTPVSGVSSPSIQDTAKMMQHHPSTTAPMYQSSPANWSNTFDMSAPHSQAPSPLPAMQTAESHFEQNYIPIKDEMPEAPAPYFGSYGVSEQHESDQGSLSPQMHNTFYPMTTGASIFEPSPMMTGPDLAMAHQHPFAPPHNFPLAAQAPVYPSNNFSDSRDKMRRRPSFGLPYPSQINRTASNPRDRQPRVRRPARMRNRPDEPPKPATQSTPLPPTTDEQPGELIIKPNCPPFERFLFERRHELETRKGEGMWKVIQGEFNEAFNTTSNIERLQMMVQRGRSQYLGWPTSEDERLKEALLWGEGQFFKMVYMKFRELGGGKAAHWGQGDIEARAVELGWASSQYEPSPMDPTKNVRRRRKVNARRHSAAGNPTPEAIQMTADERSDLINDIIETRNLKPEFEEEEDARLEMQQMRLQQAQAKATRGAKQQQTQEELLASGGRVTRSVKPSATKAAGKARVQKPRAA
ncbi:hypothetical protein CkaCkLH20_06737 [Colletotrichum karsti]|uniref:Uncharacterized protein n=1 Tax=Colletotrichum karsti TaxID=1095194 RepID=A0A9P6LK97_9PEZI|nr:uncharacterized protein CkaCkLH20_06737 [Colletotrichum karsti]KAF9875805.1 hypothetical protein CkaCkLH20_06737 [Colletotrichum karsti]